ncbi:larval cuticle protein 2-like [Musca domestica]|uniref:Larval cuticle protein 2-like n=1 Tax=Musca domestica TaxID=7370 RepID=A0ABM3V1I4_MUSDO|nr:larval cuticle protein 2-like [Musca domestica]
MFKFIVLCALIATAVALPKYGGKNTYKAAYGSHAPASSGGHHASGDEVHAETTNFAADVNEHGFQYAYDTTNDIHAAASGDENGDHKGDFSWVSPEGEHIAVQYVADENGYQPNSALLPTPPPIPEAILKALEYIRTHPPKEVDHEHSAAASYRSNTFSRSNSNNRGNSNKQFGRHF